MRRLLDLLVHTLLLCAASLRKLDTTVVQVKAGFFYRTPRVSQAIVVCLSLAAQLPSWGLVVSLVRPVAFTGATHALKALSAPLYRKYTER